MSKLRTIIAAFAAAFLLPTVGLAANQTEQVGDYTWTYSVKDGGATVVGVEPSPVGAVSIPSSLGGYAVTVIGANAFKGKGSLTAVTLPSSVKGIGHNAFVGDSVLTTVMFNEGLVEIQYDAFKDCVALKEIKLPSTLRTIGNNAFNNCDALTEIEIPDSVTSFGTYVFNDCSTLERVKVGDGVQSVPSHTFYECSILSEVTLGARVGTLGDYAFSKCPRLARIELPASVRTIKHNAFGGEGSLQTVVLNEGLTTIEYEAFYNCTGLKDVKLPSTLTEIGNWAFYNCDALTEIVLPDSVTSLGTYAFAYCDNLIHAEIGNGLYALPNYTFYNCGRLRGVTFGTHIDTIGTYAFAGCSMLRYLEFRSTGPVTVGNNALGGVPAKMTVYVGDGATGFESTWQGFTVKNVREMPENPYAPYDLQFFAPEGWPAPAYLTVFPKGASASLRFVEGNPIYLSAAICERWQEQPVEGKVDLKFSDDAGNSSVVCVSETGIALGEDVRLEAQEAVEAAGPGEHMLTVQIDPDGAFVDGDPKNNKVEFRYTVVPGVKTTFVSLGGEVGSWFYESGAEYGGFPDAPERPGFTLVGWFTEEEDGDLVTASSRVPGEPRTLYARWAETEHEIVEVGGKLPTGRTTWKSGNIYRVTSALTVPSGATLAVENDVTVKFEKGMSLTVEEGGTLEATGTRALPIVFTSIKDDAHGGDVDGDGGLPAYDDWESVVVAGTVKFEYVSLLYGGGESDSERSGMLIGKSGGRISLKCCTLAHALYDGIFSRATVTAENTVICDCDRGVNTCGGKGVFANCVIDACRWGVMAEGGAGEYRNCIITRFSSSDRWPTGWGASLWAGGSLKLVNCDVWSNEPNTENYKASPTTENCISADPLFLDPDKGDFRIDPASPCVDAGNGAYAPETDYFGSPRMDVADADDTGTPAADGACPDIGIHEVGGAADVPAVDLLVTSVTAPETLTVGDKARISWTEENVGEGPTRGTWRDELELIAANGQVVPLGTFLNSRTIEVGGSCELTEEFTVPCAAEGPCRIRVVANKDRDLYETVSDNNAGVSRDDSTLTVKRLSLVSGGDPYTLTLAAGSETGYRLDYGGTGAAVMLIRGAGELAAWMGAGAMAARNNAVRSAVQVAPDAWVVQVPEGGEARVSVANDGQEPVAASLFLQTGEFLLLETGVTTAANAGIVTLVFAGNGFTEDMDCRIERNGASIMAQSLLVEEGVKATAVFDVEGAATGEWTLRISKGGAERSLAVLNLVEPVLGAKWNCRLDVSDTIRSGRIYAGSFAYGNEGDASMKAPYVRIRAQNGTLIRLSESDAWRTEIEFIAASDTHPASTLKAGDTSRIPFFYRTSSDTTEFECAYTLSSDEAFPWEDARTEMKPASVADEAWGFAFAALRGRLGESWNDYLARLRADCDHLLKIGSPVKRLDRILTLEVNAALGIDAAVPQLAAATDLSRAGRGFGLSFMRTYPASMCRRFDSGALGYGWTDNYSMTVRRQDDSTIVVRLPSGGSYSFTRATGAWMPEDARDRTELAESGSQYVLTYRNGVKQTFSKSSGRMTAMEDNQGHAIAFTYSGANLTKVAHSDGQTLTFAYASGRITSVEDDQGRKVNYRYSGGLLVAVTAADGLVTRYEYVDEPGSPRDRALKCIRQPDGTTRDFTYDEGGLLASSAANGDRLVTRIVRDELGSHLLVAPDGGTTAVILGANGERLRTVALGEEVAQTYTGDALLESTVAPSGRRNRISYNKDGDPIGSTSAGGAVTSFAYDSVFGNLASVTDARGHSLGFGQDELGRGTSASLADGSAARLEYDARGDVVRSTNRRGESIAYEYDDEGNLVGKTWPDGRTFGYAYDAKGNLVSATDSETGTTTLEYDAAERVTKITYPKGRGFAFEYDASGRPTARISADGTEERYSYDALGRLEKVTGGGGTIYVANAYDAVSGRLSRQTYGNGLEVACEYDLLGRTTAIRHKQDGRAIAFFEYAYDADGRCVSQTTKEGVETYAYDADGRLVSVEYPDGTSEAFTYDAVGNRLTSDGATYVANDLNQYTRIDRNGKTSKLTYDLDGNLTAIEDADGRTEYAYDPLNRLVSVENAAKGIRWSCRYDAFGNRVSVTDNGVTTERVFVQGALPSVADEYEGETLKRHHVVVGAVRLADVAGKDVRYYHADILGSVRLATDGQGQELATSDYRAFGEVRRSSGERTDAGYVGTLGVETDPTGLLFMRNRYYSADMGRFVQMDPMGIDSGDVNAYSYCANAGIQKTDITGLTESWREAFGSDASDIFNGSVVNPMIDTAGKYGAALTVDHVIGDGISHPRLLGGNGIQLKGGDLTRAANIDGWWKIGGKSIGAAMSLGSIYERTQAGDPKGVIAATVKGIVGVVASKYVLAWDIGYMVGEGAAWLVNRLSGRTPVAQRYVLTGNTVTSWDPNEMRGPAGTGKKRYVRQGDWMNYTIYFENKAEATAAAQEVFVDLPMDPNLDWSTLELGEIAFGEHIDMGLSGKGHGVTDYANPGSNTFVRTTVTSKDGVLSWYLRDWDPTTMDNFPADPRGGFLPPNDPETHCGEGHLSYRVRVREDAPNGATITASAQIVFDSNPMIETDPAWWNTVGTGSGEGLDDPEPTPEDLEPVTFVSSPLTYTGYLTDGSEVSGLVTVKVAKNGKITATVQLPENGQSQAMRKYSYVGRLSSDGQPSELFCAKTGWSMLLSVGAGVVSASDVSAGGDVKYGLTGRLMTKNMPMFVNALNGAVWSVALRTQMEEYTPALMNGYSCLTVTAAKQGKVKVSGLLADGTKVSVTAQGMVFSDCLIVPVKVPLYKGKAGGFSLKLKIQDDVLHVGNLSRWSALVNAMPASAEWETPLVSAKSPLSAGAAFHLDAADIPLAVVVASDIASGSVSTLPDGVEVAVLGDKWALPKAGKVALVKGAQAANEVDTNKFLLNPSGLKLSYAAKKGTFKGSFALYQDVSAGKPKLKKVSATVNGVVVDGIGYGSAVIKKVGAVPVVIGK